MTREQAAKLLPVIKEYAEGKSVEWWNPVDEKWIEVLEMPLAGDYRIKPTPREFWLVGRKDCPTMPWGVWNTKPAQYDPIGCEIVHVREVLE